MHLAVAGVGAVLLEGDAHHAHASALHHQTALHHQFHHLRGDPSTHRVVQQPTVLDDLAGVAEVLGTVGQIVGVHTDAVTSHKTRVEVEEVPFRASSVQHIVGVDAHLVEDHRQLVHEGDVDVALRVLDHLGGLRHGDGSGAVHTGLHHHLVDLGDLVQRLRIATRHDLLDGLEGVDLVTGVDSLGRVTQLPVLLVFQSRELLDDGDAELLRQTGVHGRLEHNVVTLGDDLADHLRSTLHGTHIGRTILVDGSGHSHDVEVGRADLFQIVGEEEIAALEGLDESLRTDFAGRILAVEVGLDLGLAHIETDHLHSLLSEGHSHGHTHVAQTNDANLQIGKAHSDKQIVSFLCVIVFCLK